MSFFKKLLAVASTVAMVATGLASAPVALAAAHGPGSVVKTSDGTVWFIDSSNQRRAFTSGGAFMTYGFLNFSQVVDANTDDTLLVSGPFIAPRDGSVFCASSTKGTDVAGECSLITGGMKAAFTSAAVFTGQGYSFSRAQYGDSSFLSKTSNIDNAGAAHRPGALVNLSGTVYLVGTSTLLGIPSIDVFNSWGYSFADSVMGNAADSSAAKSGVMCARVAGQLNPSFTGTCDTVVVVPGDDTLHGGAGDLQDVKVLSTYSNEKVLEGDNDAKVMSFELEADNGSDLGIQNVKLSVKQTELGAGSSTRLNQYIDSVSVWQGSTKVGSADVDEFSENGDIFSRNIALSHAVVKDGEKSTFTVTVDAISNVDSDDLDQDLTMTLDSVRFIDAQSAVITDSSTGELSDPEDLSDNTIDGTNSVKFSFQDLTTSGDIEAKLSKATDSPDAQVVEVDSTSDTNDVLLLKFKVKATGTDMTIDNMQFSVTPTGANANEIVKSFKLLQGSDEIDSIDSPSIATTVTDQIVFTDLEDDISIDADDTATFSLVADINDLEGAFGDGDSILASYTNANFIDVTCTSNKCTVIDDENGDTVVAGDRTGSAIGEIQTFVENGIMVSLVGTPTAVVTPGDPVAPSSDEGTFTIVFDVTAFGNDIYIDKTAPDTSGTGVAGDTASDIAVTGTGTVVASITSPSGATEFSQGFLVEEGTTERFSIVTHILATASGFFDVRLNDILFALTNVDGDQVYSSNLEDFKTPQVFLTDR